MGLELFSWQKEAGSTAHAQIKEGWNVSMAMPVLDLAEQYDRILRSLGFETQEPEPVEEGWVVKWREKGFESG